ncbi:MAG: hypothetical protein HYX89_00860 [Chloroflexi bacterium]|nr:hypothetical protein [Chloroflexota bacterium]
MAAQQSRCYQELLQQWCEEVGQERGSPCPSAQACLLLTERYETRELDTRQYYCYMKERLAMERTEAVPASLGAAA